MPNVLTTRLQHKDASNSIVEGNRGPGPFPLSVDGNSDPHVLARLASRDMEPALPGPREAALLPVASSDVNMPSSLQDQCSKITSKMVSGASRVF